MFARYPQMSCRLSQGTGLPGSSAYVSPRKSRRKPELSDGSAQARDRPVFGSVDREDNFFIYDLLFQSGFLRHETLFDSQKGERRPTQICVEHIYLPVYGSGD
jgi:hypothetical protein